MTSPADDIAVCVLSSGLRCVAVRRETAAEYCGVGVRAGSCDEAPGSEGLAHFVEHTIFKGTSTHPASHIINRMENVGGELNAYTTKEETFIYSVFPSGYLRRAATLIADLVTDSRFPASEIDRERTVVLEEIDSYLDSPSEAVFDEFDELFFSGTPLAHNILGTEETVRRFSPEDCRRWLEQWYTAPNMVFYYLGPEKPGRVFSMAEKAFASLPVRMPDAKPFSFVPRSEGFDVCRHNDNHQAHTVLGTYGPSIDGPRMAYALFNNILGGPGMNSRLNVALRERRGLVYSVDSALSRYAATGLFSIYFGCDPADTRRCLRIARQEINRLADKELSGAAFRRAQCQLSGQMRVASASLEGTVLGAGRSLLRHGRVIAPDEMRDRLLALTPADLRDAAATIASGPLSSLTLG